MALVIMGHGAGTALLQRKSRLCPVQRLDLAFLIDGNDNGMGWRGDIEPDDVMQLLGKGLVIRQLEAAPAVRRRTMLVPDLDHSFAVTIRKVETRASLQAAAFNARRVTGELLEMSMQLRYRKLSLDRQEIDYLKHFRRCFEEVDASPGAQCVLHTGSDH